MIPVIVNGVEKNLKTEWNEVTLNEWSKMLQHPKADEAFLLSILLDIPYIELVNYNTEQFDDTILRHLIFTQQDPQLFSQPVPDVILVDGKGVEVPKDLKQCTWYQRSMLKTLIQEYSKERTGNSVLFLRDYPSLAAHAIAIYIQPLLHPDKKVDGNVIPEVTKIIAETLPITQAYPLAAFFLNSWISSSQWNARSSVMNRSRKRKKQE